MRNTGNQQIHRFSQWYKKPCSAVPFHEKLTHQHYAKSLLLLPQYFRSLLPHDLKTWERFLKNEPITPGKVEWNFKSIVHVYKPKVTVFNPFPNKPFFLRVFLQVFRKKPLEKGKIHHNEHFSLFPPCILTIWRAFCHFHQI